MEGISPEAEKGGLSFQRPISLWRTAYSTVTQVDNDKEHTSFQYTRPLNTPYQYTLSTPSSHPLPHYFITSSPCIIIVTQSRASLPDAVGAVTWIAPYAPHHSTFVPVYAR